MGEFLSSHFPANFNKADNIYITSDFKSITSTSFQTELFTNSLRDLQKHCLRISWRCPTLLLLCRDRAICATGPHTRLVCISFLWFVWFGFIFAFDTIFWKIMASVSLSPSHWQLEEVNIPLWSTLIRGRKQSAARNHFGAVW